MYHSLEKCHGFERKLGEREKGLEMGEKEWKWFYIFKRL